MKKQVWGPPRWAELLRKSLTGVEPTSGVEPLSNPVVKPEVRDITGSKHPFGVADTTRQKSLCDSAPFSTTACLRQSKYRGPNCFP